MPRPLLTSETTERDCPQSPDLDEEDGEESLSSYIHHPTPPPGQGKSHSSLSDDHMEDTDEPTPFSLKGFEKAKNCYVAKDEEGKSGMYMRRLARHCLDFEEESLDLQEPFYKDPVVADHLADEEEESWGRSYYCPGREKGHMPRVTSGAACSPYDSLHQNTSRTSGNEVFVPWAHASDPCIAYTAHEKAPENCALHEESIGDREYPSLQLSYQELQEENSMLRRKIKSIQNFSESQTHMVKSLERRLRATAIKEDKEARGLESILHQAEHNLQLMTQRALRAESNAGKLRQEMSFLQSELEFCKVENENLRADQSADLGAVKQNIKVALQNLRRIIVGANLSIKQLVSGAELLHLVADLLKSIDKISEVNKEDDL
ncbi:endosome-associated-trafficking regulator 1 [Alligator mississippiensis]|uniref:Endosome-associated-trafficking regulator 1 n=1 Tax=Alligator mississippiensis TaxID=8496 RepID=A0A151NHQ6_ALLMI|nr:endosome-associated-trafficking regulator 1 [Alligator mississippiensis]KYO36327.1 serologically defined colon cancer antigen 3 [Alligator mississippiensis]